MKTQRSTARAKGCAGVLVCGEGEKISAEGRREEEKNGKRRSVNGDEDEERFLASLGMTRGIPIEGGTLTRGEGEDEEVALAGGNEGEEAAIGRDGEVTEGEAMKDGRGNRLADGDVLVSNGGRHGG